MESSMFVQRDRSTYHSLTWKNVISQPFILTVAVFGLQAASTRKIYTCAKVCELIVLFISDAHEDSASVSLQQPPRPDETFDWHAERIWGNVTVVPEAAKGCNKVHLLSCRYFSLLLLYIYLFKVSNNERGSGSLIQSEQAGNIRARLLQ